MLLSRDAARRGHTPLSNDDVEKMLRWGLQDWMSRAEPSAQTWNQILARVRAPEPAPRQRRRPARSLPLAPLVQGVLVCAMLLASGLQVDRRPFLTPRGHVPDSTAISEVPPPATFPEDAPQARVIWRREQALSHAAEPVASAGSEAPRAVGAPALARAWKQELLRE